MRIKSIICLTLSFSLCLCLSACKKSELNLDGDDTYIYNESSSSVISEDDGNIDELDMFEYTSSQLNTIDALDWETSESDDYTIFYIKNSSGIKIDRIAYRPNEYSSFKTLSTTEIEANLVFFKIAKENLLSYELFDFAIVTEENTVTVFEKIALLNNRGLEITYKNDTLGFKYLK